MTRLAKLGGKAHARPNPERVHPSLRDYLRTNVPPERVWRALELALEGQNESARVSASRVLMDALHEPQQFEERDFRTKIRAETKALAADAGEKILRLIVSRADAIVRAVIAEFERQLEDDELAADARRRLTEVLADVQSQLDEAGRIRVERRSQSEGVRDGREPQQFQRPA
jgi:hypothetical protein